MLKPLLFTIISLGLKPRIALESMDSGQPRIEKILTLVRESRFGIHDLSRIQAQKRNELFRLNMPLELGIDFGCRRFGREPLQDKRQLILEAERYRYQAAISDLAGSDIAAHENKPYLLVSIVRDWLQSETRVDAVGPDGLWVTFNQFESANRERLRAKGFSSNDIERLPINALVRCMTEWVREQLA